MASYRSFITKTRPAIAVGAAFFAIGTSLSRSIAATDAPATPAAEKPLTPEAIYLRSVHAMKAAPIPPYVTFRENIVGRNFQLSCTSDGMSLSLHHGDIAGTYDVYYRTSDGSAVSKPVPATTASPCSGALLAPAGSSIASMGVPQASPSPGSDAASSAGGPPIIAAVRVESAGFYRITLAGMETIGSNDVYHLRLSAYRDPDTHPLTDLYVDVRSFLVREARGEVSGHYVIASGRFAGIVDFDRVGDYWLVERERFDVAANALLVHARMNATIDGSDYTTPSELPGIVFPSAKASPTPAATATATATV